MACITETDDFADIIGGPLNGTRYRKPKKQDGQELVIDNNSIHLLRKRWLYKFIDNQWVYKWDGFLSSG